jgi:hypothetical protein
MSLLTKVGNSFLSGCSSLPSTESAELRFDNLEKVGYWFLNEDASLRRLSFPSLTKIGEPNMQGEEITFLEGCTSLRYLAFGSVITSTNNWEETAFNRTPTTSINLYLCAGEMNNVTGGNLWKGFQWMSITPISFD